MHLIHLLLYKVKGRRPPSAESETRTKFGPVAAWIIACVPGFQVFKCWYLACCVLGEGGIHCSKKSIPRMTAYVHVKSRVEITTPSYCRDKGYHYPGHLPMQSDPSILFIPALGGRNIRVPLELDIALSLPWQRHNVWLQSRVTP